MLVVGLTGGIASGKTAVSDAFARRGVPVIDTDVLARELVAPGQPALAEIAERFGAQCLTPGGELDRRRLRNTIFDDPAARADLEAILHPRIRRAVRERLQELQTPYCIVVVPLLVENKGVNDLIQRILVVDVPQRIQLERVMARDRIGEQQALAIIQAQASREQRLQAADDVLENTGNRDALDAGVETLHLKYQRIASQ